MVANFFKISKRRNSTAQPSGQGLYIYDVTINDADTSILNPSIRVSITTTDVLKCNYVYILAFSRYYYITNWTYSADGTWTASLAVDSLASWRDDILATGGYVGRSATLFDSSIIDSMYPATAYCKTVHDSISTGFNCRPSNGTYVIGTISSESPNVGAVSYYMVTASEMAKLLQKMTTVSATDADWSDISTITGDVLKSIVNPMQYIVSCKWFPVPRTISSTNAIKLWGWDTTAKGQKITDSTSFITKLLTIDLSNITIDESAYYTNFPLFAPYAQYALITSWGTFDLDANIMASNRSIEVAFSINLISGTALLRCQVPNVGTVGNNVELFRKEVQFAVDIPLAQISTDYVNMAKSTVNSLGAMGNVGGWLTNPGSTAAAVASSAIDAAVYALSPSVQSTSGQGATYAPEIEYIAVQQIRYATFPPDVDDLGRPVKKSYPRLALFQKSAASSGFVQMDHSNFEAFGVLPAERDEIINMLETGVFLE